MLRGDQEAPRKAKSESQRRQVGPKTSPRVGKLRQRGVKMEPDEAKMVPKSSG